MWSDKARYFHFMRQDGLFLPSLFLDGTGSNETWGRVRVTRRVPHLHGTHPIFRGSHIMTSLPTLVMASSTVPQNKRPWAATISDICDHDGSSDDMASNSPSAVSVRHPIPTEHPHQDGMGGRRAQEQAGSDTSVLGNKRSCSGTGTTASPATTSLFLRSSSPEQAYDSRETQYRRNIEPSNRFRKRVTIIQPISRSWESDAGAGRQKLQGSNSFELASPLCNQPPSPPSWRSFATKNAGGFDAPRQLEQGRVSPQAGKQSHAPTFGTPPQQHSNVGFQSVRRSRAQASPQRPWPHASDVLPPIPPLFATGVAAAATSLLALGEVSIVNLPVALMSPYKPLSSHSLVAARSASDMANEFMRQNPHLLASGSATMAVPQQHSPSPPAFHGAMLYPSNHYHAGGVYGQCEDDWQRVYKTGSGGSPDSAYESASPSKYAANSPNSSPEPASRDSGDGFMQGSGSGSNGTSRDNSGSPGHSGGEMDSTSKPAGSLVQVHTQLNQLYQWYCNNKEVYMHQARKGLDNLERSSRFAAAHTYNNSGRPQHAASRSVPPAEAGAAVLAQQTADVQRAIAKAMQIMQASSEVERQARPEGSVMAKGRGPQFGRDATHNAVALALARVAAATGGLKQEGRAPLQVQA